MDELEARIAELAEQEELRSIRPDLDGNAVMAHLGIAPGPAVGEALAFLLEAAPRRRARSARRRRSAASTPGGRHEAR